jgi:hypothetical protein
MKLDEESPDLVLWLTVPQGDVRFGHLAASEG